MTVQLRLVQRLPHHLQWVCHGVVVGGAVETVEHWGRLAEVAASGGMAICHLETVTLENGDNRKL